MAARKAPSHMALIENREGLISDFGGHLRGKTTALSLIVVRLAMVMFAIVGGTVSAQAQELPKYVGPETCKTCHSDAYSKWKSTGHGKSDRSFTPRQKASPTCTLCHAPQADTGGMNRVTCEACHGPGGNYVVQMAKGNGSAVKKSGVVMPNSKTCDLCHGSRSVPSKRQFDFVKRKSRIRHGRKNN